MSEERTEGRTARELVSGAPFGPGFFLGQLRAFARERCPDPREMLPAVELHLATGEVFDLCHVMGLAPAFVALAVRETRGGRAIEGMPMRTELVPYALITRVTIRAVRGLPSHVGFNAEHAPDLLPVARTPEAALRTAASAPGESHLVPGQR